MLKPYTSMPRLIPHITMANNLNAVDESYRQISNRRMLSDTNKVGGTIATISNTSGVALSIRTSGVGKVKWGRANATLYDVGCRSPFSRLCVVCVGGVGVRGRGRGRGEGGKAGGGCQS